MAKNFTEANWNTDVLGSDKPVLVDFWAEWCGPCKALDPMIEELSKNYEGKAVIGKLNVDDNPGIATKYGIRGMPTMLVFKGGQLVDKVVGVASKQTLSDKIDAQMAVGKTS
jgi:thioredoxin 1